MTRGSFGRGFRVAPFVLFGRAMHRAAALLVCSVTACGTTSETPPGPAGSGGTHAASDAGAPTGGQRTDGGSGGGGGLSGVNQSAGGQTTGDAGGMADAANARHFRLATTGAELVVTGAALGLQLTEANVADDADVYAVHQEFYGLPWDAFEANAAPPPEWVAVMDRLAKDARAADKPVFLSVTMLDGQRQHLAPRTTIESGQVKTTENVSVACYDFATAPDAASKRAAYQRYVAWMVDEFSPAYLNVAIEVNLFFEKCPSATPGLVDVANETYDAVKKAHPDTLVFPSLQIDHLYGYSKDSCADPANRGACFDALYAVVAPLKRDRFAMSTYPYMSDVGVPGNLPADWFSRGAARAGEIPLVAETGWPSTDVVVRARDGTCPKYFSFDESTSAAYLSRVLRDAETEGLDLVTWWSDRDLLVTDLMTDCPCTFDGTWCSVLDLFRGPASTGTTDTQLFGELLLKVFGTMGIRTYDGTEKAAPYAAWSAARARPFVTR